VKQPFLSIPLLDFLPHVRKNRKTTCKIEDWSSLPLIIKALNERCFLECDEKVFDEIASSFDLLSDKNVFVPYVEEEKKAFSKTYHQEMFERASVLVSSCLNSICLFVVDKRALKAPLYYKKKESPYVISGGEESRKDLLSFLHENNYLRVEAVCEPGEYAVRGGVFDIFSFGSSFPFRAGFLGGEGGILYFNTSSGSVVKETNSANVYPFPQKPKISIQETSLNADLYIKCKGGVVEIINKKTKRASVYKVKETFKTISYSLYKNKKNKSIHFCSYLLSRGCEYGGVFYLPRWFSGAKDSVGVIKKIPLIGSLSLGDYYVHERFGICQYTGSITGTEDDKKGFVSLKFSDGKMNLAVSLLGQIYFYAPSVSGCTLGSLNKSRRWEKQRKKAEEEAGDFIKNVLSSYVKRESSLVLPYKKDQDLIGLFLSEFSFLDTPDQSLAWEKILEDLCSERPMHRLLCGDVGFGKTEIAMRAVFLSFINKKQSVLLAPTTILSHQLFSCFSERFFSFGCKIAQVSRLTKNNAQNISRFLRGETDVLIGTHSVIKNSAVLSKASLLIVDEEHRFGVKDKEKIIEISPSCNYLSMSATPIPRTLQLALSGVRNISTLLSAPVERMPIITNVHSFNIKTIKNYFLKELNRDGQVYFVDNSVDSLKQMYVYFHKELPNISSSFLYGGMNKENIKTIMRGFRNNKIKILFSTTIIESGIDVSRANTIVINNAHMFGLSQLHQLRGRVGRSNKQSYACLLIPKKIKITQQGRARLLSIKKHSSLGSGYSLALEDLQIRGAGNLFGYAQSGEAVIGFDYYSKILSKTMRFGSFSTNRPDPIVDFDNAYIPSSLIEDEAQRIFYYKKISDCLSEGSVVSFFNETTSLFGPLPKEVSLLFDSKKLSFLAEKTPVVGIKKTKQFFIITASSFGIKNIPVFLNNVSLYFNSKNIPYVVSSDSSFLKIKFSYIKEDSYILLENFLKKIHV